MNYKDMLHRELIFLDENSNNREELFESISHKLMDLGYVKSSYQVALNSREDEFPTGLITKFLPIALPHADPENVNKAFIAVARNNQEIPMLQMGSNEEMRTKYFFFLGITDSSHQVILLQKFMQLLQDKEFVDKLVSANSVDEVYTLLDEYFD